MAVYTEDRTVGFVHVPKCAGWSVKLWMHRALGSRLVVPAETHGTEDWEGAKLRGDMPKGHLRLAEWEDRMGVAPEDFETIVVVTRDPYEHALSQWLYWRELWSEGRLRMVQHRVAMQYARFEDWVLDPRSEYHVCYDYHDHDRPRYRGDDAPGYADYGGYWLYWAGLGGEIPDNVLTVDLSEVDTLPEVLSEYVESDVEMPRLNAGSADATPADHYTEAARERVEQMYAHAFETWYEPHTHDLALV